MTDDDVKKISRFLENGGTMLANHCDACGAPLFRFKGEIICPLCSEIEAGKGLATTPEKALAVSAGVPAKKQNAPQKSGKSKTKTTAAGTNVENMTDYTTESIEANRIRELILMKLSAVAEEMQNETDSRRIFESLEIIEKGLDLIERLY